MKKFLLIAIIICGLYGCEKEDRTDYDGVGIGHYTWINNSTHQITITVIREFENEIILPGESIEKTAKGFIHPYPLGSYIVRGIRIYFDEGTYGGAFTVPVEYPTEPYNPCNPESYVKNEFDQDGLPHCRWTYTFTNADYEAAVARGPMTQE